MDSWRRLKDRGWIRKQGSECGMLSPDQPGKRFLSVACQTFAFKCPGGTKLNTRWHSPYFCPQLLQATPPRYVTKFASLKPGILRNALMTAIRPIFPARRTADYRDLAWRSALSRPPHAK